MKEVVIDRPADDVRAARETELAHQPSSVVLDCPERDVQLSGDVGVPKAVGEKPRSPSLPVGEMFVDHPFTVTYATAARIAENPQRTARLYGFERWARHGDFVASASAEV